MYLGTNVSVWAPSCMCTIMWAQSCLGTNVSRHSHVWTQSFEHNHVWTQMCAGTNVCGHKRVWTQTCVDTNVSGHKRVWAQSCSCMGTNVWNFFQELLKLWKLHSPIILLPTLISFVTHESAITVQDSNIPYSQKKTTSYLYEHYHCSKLMKRMINNASLHA